MYSLVDEDWVLSLSLFQTIDNSSSLINLNEQFVASNLAVNISTNITSSRWRYGGRLWTAYYFLGEYHLTKYYDLKLDFFHLFCVEKLANNNYFLFYEPPKWFSTFDIKIWENTNMALYTDSSQPAGTASTATSATVAVASNTTPSSIMAANVNRKGYSIRNRGTKAAIIGFSSTFTANTAFLSLAANAVYESEKNYTGDLFAMTTAANAATDLVVTEFT
jgi:hypothetical protein